MGKFKFRAWDDIHKKMIYDFVIQSQGIWIDKYKECTDRFCVVQEYGLIRIMSIYQEYVMQKTTLEDYQKTPIWEGDIVKQVRFLEDYQWVIDHDRENADIRVVEIPDIYFEQESAMNSFDSKNYIVIGNKYKNPELLGEPK